MTQTYRGGPGDRGGVQDGIAVDVGTAAITEKRELNPWGYLGTPSGVVDLASGELLPPEQGRLHKVNRTTGVPLSPANDPDHWGVDALMGH